ncbi:MAG: hypothetical protein ACR2QC_05410 [Gammaproteobacteria bacterium]
MKIPPRAPAQVMRLPVLGAFCQTRLSFMRVLSRRLQSERWRFSRPVWNIDGRGEGVAVYRATNARARDTYSLVVFSRDLPPHLRSDRVIAEAWDAAFTLFDGVPSPRDIKKMRTNVPLQEAGRNDPRQLVLSRANRSARAFSAAVESLARGECPSRGIAESGYLMRTTAVYGNGKFGTAIRERIRDRPEFSPPFAAEMLAVFMFRAFPADLVEHLATAKSTTAAKFARESRRAIGIGNSTGLGMAPFLVNRPILLHHWISARETALARVRSLPAADENTIKQFLSFAKKAEKQAARGRTDDPGQRRKNARVRDDLRRLRKHFRAADINNTPLPWNTVYRGGGAEMSAEGRETLVSLLLEPHGELIDDLAAAMAADETFFLDGGATVGDTRDSLARYCKWTARGSFSTARSRAQFWYVSEEKQEPRLGARGAEPGAELELPLAVMRDARAFAAALAGENADLPLALFLSRHPEHRGAARRAQIAARFPFGEIRDNLIAAEMSPLDLLRCKLSFFGASQFDPRSDRWLRINMFQYAPYPDEIGAAPADEWAWEAS